MDDERVSYQFLVVGNGCRSAAELADRADSSKATGQGDRSPGGSHGETDVNAIITTALRGGKAGQAWYVGDTRGDVV